MRNTEIGKPPDPGSPFVPRKAKNNLGYQYDPLPNNIDELVRDGRLKAIDVAVLKILLGFTPRGHNSCWALVAVVAEKLGRKHRCIQMAYGRLGQCGVAEQVKLDGPDPIDRDNRTGWRIVFPWRSGKVPVTGQRPDRRHWSERMKNATPQTSEFMHTISSHRDAKNCTGGDAFFCTGGDAKNCIQTSRIVTQLEAIQHPPTPRLGKEGEDGSDGSIQPTTRPAEPLAEPVVEATIARDPSDEADLRKAIEILASKDSTRAFADELALKSRWVPFASIEGWRWIVAARGVQVGQGRSIGFGLLVTYARNADRATLDRALAPPKPKPTIEYFRDDLPPKRSRGQAADDPEYVRKHAEWQARNPGKKGFLPAPGPDDVIRANPDSTQAIAHRRSEQRKAAESLAPLPRKRSRGEPAPGPIRTLAEIMADVPAPVTEASPVELDGPGQDPIEPLADEAGGGWVELDGEIVEAAGPPDDLHLAEPVSEPSTPDRPDDDPPPDRPGPEPEPPPGPGVSPAATLRALMVEQERKELDRAKLKAQSRASAPAPSPAPAVEANDLGELTPGQKAFLGALDPDELARFRLLSKPDRDAMITPHRIAFCPIALANERGKLKVRAAPPAEVPPDASIEEAIRALPNADPMLSQRVAQALQEDFRDDPDYWPMFNTLCERVRCGVDPPESLASPYRKTRERMDRKPLDSPGAYFWTCIKDYRRKVDLPALDFTRPKPRRGANTGRQKLHALRC